MILLGTGSPLASPDRSRAATLIVAGQMTIMVDTGSGAGMRMQAAGYNDISMVLYTHFHSDHISALGDIMVTRSINNAQTPLTVKGPIGTSDVAQKLLAAYDRDTQYRIAHHGDKYPAIGMTLNATDHEPGVIYQADGLTITMFDVRHEPIDPAVGYRFDYRGKCIVVSGDTRAFAGMVEAAKNCDLLVHEAMDGVRLGNVLAATRRQQNDRMSALLEELMVYHTPNLELAKIARDAGVKKLLLTHLIPVTPTTDAAEMSFVRGMSEIFSGPIIVGRDLMTVIP